MGLDMYLNKKTYVKQWSYQSPEEQHEVTVKKGGENHPHIKPERVSYIIEQVGYWRKFNALHQWFVENCQDGEDDCRESYVGSSQLKELLEEVLKPIKDAHASGDVEKTNQIAEELLPTQEGFFFGSSEIDDWYIKNVYQTIEMLEGLLNEIESECDFYYQASW